MELLLNRDILHPEFTLGRLYLNGFLYCFTCEDTDRKLEENPKGKIHGRTAIPRGRYRVQVTFSPRFQKLLPEIKGVPGYVGVRFHGGNTADDTEGCPLLGRVRTVNGVAQCKDTVDTLIKKIQEAEKRHEEIWVEVK